MALDRGLYGGSQDPRRREPLKREVKQVLSLRFNKHLQIVKLHFFTHGIQSWDQRELAIVDPRLYGVL